MVSKGKIYFVDFDPFGFSHSCLACLTARKPDRQVHFQGKAALINITTRFYITAIKHKQSFPRMFAEQVIWLVKWLVQILFLCQSRFAH